MQKRRGISPVIATVIIVAVTIAVAIAVAFWMTGIVGLFTAAEKLEIVSANAVNLGGAQGWTVTLTVRNTGTTTTSIDTIYINGYEAFVQNNANPQLTCVANLQAQVDNQQPVNQLPVTLQAGQSVTIRFNIQNPGQACNYVPTNAAVFTPAAGGSIEVKLHSTGGKEYPKLLVLP
jgi:flagellin-like protein